MSIRKRLVLVLLATSLSGCATIIDGVHQEITIESSPPAARCELWRHGSQLAVVEGAPQTIRVSLSRRNIDITCELHGHLTTTSTLVPKGGEDAFLPLAIAGPYALPSVIVDTATSATYRYSKHVVVNLPQASYEDAPTSVVANGSAHTGGDPIPSSEVSNEIDCVD